MRGQTKRQTHLPISDFSVTSSQQPRASYSAFFRLHHKHRITPDSDPAWGERVDSCLRDFVLSSPPSKRRHAVSHFDAPTRGRMFDLVTGTKANMRTPSKRLSRCEVTRLRLWVGDEVSHFGQFGELQRVSGTDGLTQKLPNTFAHQIILAVAEGHCAPTAGLNSCGNHTRIYCLTVSRASLDSDKTREKAIATLNGTRWKEVPARPRVVPPVSTSFKSWTHTGNGLRKTIGMSKSTTK